MLAEAETYKCCRRAEQDSPSVGYFGWDQCLRRNLLWEEWGWGLPGREEVSRAALGMSEELMEPQPDGSMASKDRRLERMTRAGHLRVRSADVG